MFFFLKPDPIQIQKHLNSAVRRGDRPTYTQGLDEAPDGFVEDHNRILLGRDCYETARRQIREWRMFNLGWVELCWEDAPMKVGVTVGVLVRLGVAWALCPARIVSVIDEPRRYGFSYATLPDHVECGEERFLVEWLPNGEVWYEILAVSRPRHWLVKLGNPLARFLQRRFAQGSMSAMLAATQRFEPR